MTRCPGCRCGHPIGLGPLTQNARGKVAPGSAHQTNREMTAAVQYRASVLPEEKRFRSDEPYFFAFFFFDFLKPTPPGFSFLNPTLPALGS